MFVVFFSVGPGSKKIGTNFAVGFGFILFTGLVSGGPRILFPDSSSDISSSFNSTCGSNHESRLVGMNHFSMQNNQDKQN